MPPQQPVTPKTSRRLQGLQLPGYITQARPGTSEPQLVLWQQQALAAWQAAAAWSHSQQQQQQGQQEDPPWLQQLLQRPDTHWAQLAAVLEAAGSSLQLHHIAAVIQLLAAQADVHSNTSESSTSDSSSDSSNDSSTGMTGPFSPSMVALAVGPVSSSSGGGGGYSKKNLLLLRRTSLLPQLTALLSTLLGPVEQQQQEEQQQQRQRPGHAQSAAAAAASDSSALDSPGALLLLQQLSQLHSHSRLGAADPGGTAALLSLVSLHNCGLSGLAELLAWCAALGQPLRSSWLAGFTSLALQQLQQVLQGADAAVDAAAGGQGEGALFGGPAVEELQQLPELLVKLLDALCRYPGPHIQPYQLVPMLQAIQPSQLSAAQLQQLLAAATALQLDPGAAWMDAAAAAAGVLLPRCGLQDQAALLLALASAGCSPDQGWWQVWFEATSSNFQGLLGEAAAGEAAAAEAGQGQPAGAAAQQLPAGVLADVMDLLLQLQQPAHEAWLAGMLQAHHMTAPEPAAVPGLLLLTGELLPHPRSFATQHRPLLLGLMAPLQQSVAELTPEQLTQALEACAVFDFKPGAAWFAWHSSGVLRLGKTFPLACLARVRDAYRALQLAPNFQLRPLLGSVNWRLQLQQARQAGQAATAERGAVLAAKNEQRRRQNERDRAALQARAGRRAAAAAADAAADAASGAGDRGRVGPEGRQQWRRRKLQPPGTLDRKF